eukprot:3689488-Amphidinium_carterae.1
MECGSIQALMFHETKGRVIVEGNELSRRYRGVALDNKLLMVTQHSDSWCGGTGFDWCTGFCASKQQIIGEVLRGANENHVISIGLTTCGAP